MNEKVMETLKKISFDEEMAAKFGACETVEAAYAFASSIGEGFTQEEFAATIEQIKASVENSAELSEEDLGKAAGGGVSEIGVSAAVTGALTVLASVGL